MRTNYETRGALMQGLADQVALELRAAINVRGKASLVVPGGTTPAPFLNALSKIDLNWRKIAVILGDERFISESSPRSNTKLLRENLFINEAANALLVPMIAAADAPEDVIDKLTKGVIAHLPIDVLIVGMGEDMHTASLFPDSPNLASALVDDAPPLAIIRAKIAGEPRITMTAPVLRAARHKHVLLTGANKIPPLEKAFATTNDLEAPIRVVIAGKNPATIHFSN